MRIPVLLFLCLLTSVALAQRQLTTLTVNYADPGQIAEVIKPYLSTGSSVSLYQNQLVLNVTAEELAKTRELLKQLDGKGRQLLISLRVDESNDDRQRSVEIDGEITSGNTTITSGSGGVRKQTRTTVRVNDFDGALTSSGNKELRVTEGIAAYISSGLSAPVQSYTTGPDGRRYYQQAYVEAIDGFYATTWVNDGMARISIRQSNDSLDNQTISTQQLLSEVSGALGQWLPIGAIGDRSNAQYKNLGSGGQSSGHNSTRLFIKVELLE